jgi:hypothetical protein
MCDYWGARYAMLGIAAWGHRHRHHVLDLDSLRFPAVRVASPPRLQGTTARERDSTGMAGSGRVGLARSRLPGPTDKVWADLRLVTSYIRPSIFRVDRSSVPTIGTQPICISFRILHTPATTISHPPPPLLTECPELWQPHQPRAAASPLSSSPLPPARSAAAWAPSPPRPPHRTSPRGPFSRRAGPGPRRPAGPDTPR